MHTPPYIHTHNNSLAAAAAVADALCCCVAVLLLLSAVAVGCCDDLHISFFGALELLSCNFYTIMITWYSYDFTFIFDSLFIEDLNCTMVRTFDIL